MGADSCRVAASPYPAYKTLERRPGKRSATGHLGRTAVCCRVAASPYPAYKILERRPGKRSATGRLGRTVDQMDVRR
ncbi:hypothetical protein QQF21_20780 [Lelliottia sp. V89_10]|uniref:hypothetical protein n=1 Tax=Lelliottia wanjuensis TaxID=3050585 RepID=UPI00249DDF72|nr:MULTISPECIES: hypothetical protein [unclassified Lelliottia]MDI3362796.1 hypothetical protein [Lelliottia sp. V89_13]MDK9547647.1 hypothetical protein [Lelliottia sp. V89_5]MDK9598057.1 hypothetical protein [Lelliottia sp. V89_10]